MTAIFDKALYVARRLQDHPAVEAVLYRSWNRTRNTHWPGPRCGAAGTLLHSAQDSRRCFGETLHEFPEALQAGSQLGRVRKPCVPRRCSLSSDAPQDRVSLIRLYVGLEEKEALASDLDQALAQIADRRIARHVLRGSNLFREPADDQESDRGQGAAEGVQHPGGEQEDPKETTTKTTTPRRPICPWGGRDPWCAGSRRPGADRQSG